MTKTAHSNYLGVVTMTMLAAVLMMLAGTKPAEAKVAGFPEGDDPIAFGKEGDIWVASIMHLENLTPDTAAYSDVDPSVSPDGRYVAFASDRDGDFEIYVANVFTGKAERFTDNRVDDRNPSWSPDGKWISYRSSHFSSPTHEGIFSAKFGS